jgi:hypothetical protein
VSLIGQLSGLSLLRAKVENRRAGHLSYQLVLLLPAASIVDPRGYYTASVVVARGYYTYFCPRHLLLLLPADSTVVARGS